MNLNDLQPVRVRGFELRVIGLPLVSPFRTSFGTQVDRRILLVRAITDQGDGWGECVSGDDPLYSSEYVESSHHVMVHHLIPRLLPTDGTSIHATDVARLLEPVKEHRMAKGAIEAAVLDAQLRANNVSLP
ncbi:MAG: o-succinylbenzoate synthase, partial [Actinomycetota bacterium]